MNALRKDLRPVLAGLGVMAWILSFPFYGPLAFQLLGDKAVAGTHGFALGYAAGFFFLGGTAGSRLGNRIWPFAAGAVGLSGIALGNVPSMFAGPLFGLAGFLAAVPFFSWAGLLSRFQQPAPVFVAVGCAANLWCWLTGLPFGSLFWSYLWLGIATLGFLTAALFLRPADTSPPASPAPRPVAWWPAFWPLLLFAVAAYTVGGLLYRVILPLVDDYQGIVWMGFLPYVLAMIIAGRLINRHYGLLSASTLVLLGLAVLPLVLGSPLPGPPAYLLSYVGVLASLAFADLIFWMGLINLARTSSVKVLGFGIGVNILILFTVGVLIDFARGANFFQMPLVAFGEVAVLFILLPVILPRLNRYPLSYPPDGDGELSFPGNPADLKEPAFCGGGLKETPPGKNPAVLELPSPRPEQAPERNDFTGAEERIFLLLLEGRKNTEIAAMSFISLNTVKFHVRNILRKTGCKTRKELKEKYAARQ